MIDPRELRIGNNVKCNGVEIAISAELLLLQLQGQIRPFEPIELTPGWLERVGFEKRENDDWIETTLDCGYLYIGSNLGDRSVTLFQNDRISTGVHCKYVHQLQNLYFALTGKELYFKPGTGGI